MERATRSNQPRKLSREQWIRRGLDAISRHGGRRLSIDELVSALGVTKGSFYWHFSGRKDFVKAVMEYWAEDFTYAVGAQVEAAGHDDPIDDLRLLMELLCEGDHPKHDIAVRAWATQEKDVARVLAKVDRFRLGIVGRIFERIGFSGDDLLARTRAFVVSQSLEGGLAVPLSKKQRLQLIEARVRLFTN